MKCKRVLFTFLVFLSIFAEIGNGWNILPGNRPKEYLLGEEISIHMNKMVSSKTFMPFPYYSLNFCQPSGGVIQYEEHIGRVLMGDVIQNSPYVFETGKNIHCQVLCSKTMSRNDLDLFEQRIFEDYRVNWELDDLPVGEKKIQVNPNGSQLMIFDQGFPLGAVEGLGKVAYIHNHVSIKILYHVSADFVGRRIVGFEVEPKSVSHENEEGEGGNEDEDEDEYLSRDYCLKSSKWQKITGLEEGKNITFTYSVEWEYSPSDWSTRWEKYLRVSDIQIHWFAITNSFLMIVSLSGVVALILLRTLKSDYKKFQLNNSEEEGSNDKGWIYLAGDIFRPPKYALLFSGLVGSGVQIFSTLGMVFSFLFSGLLSPANRTDLLTSIIILFLLLGIISGYYSAQLNGVFDNYLKIDWLKGTILSAVIVPAVIFIVIIIINIIFASFHSSAYIHFLYIAGFVMIWLIFSVPLTILGSRSGFRKVENPRRVNLIPRMISSVPWYTSKYTMILLGGIIPFISIFIEFYFIFTSIWYHQFYYMFEFLFIIFIILVITCAEVSIIITYIQISNDNYEWWWNSFLSTASSAIYVFLFAIYYYFVYLQVSSFASTLLYLGYTFIICFILFVLTGSIGFYSSSLFLTQIYNNVKFD